MAVLGLCCCAQAFSSCNEQGTLFVVVHQLFIVVASRAVEHKPPRPTGFRSGGAQALLSRGMQDPPRLRVESMSSVLAVKFLTTGPPGEVSVLFLTGILFVCFLPTMGQALLLGKRAVPETKNTSSEASWSL